MDRDLRIIRNGRGVPVVAFFGTKGGVGKTTIARRFAELVTLAPSGPNVLLVDADVYHRGMTVEMTTHTPATCKTVHDYIAARNPSGVEVADMSGLVKGTRPDSGQLFFIPASTPDSEEVFRRAAEIGPEALLEILYKVASSAVQQYDCACVVIDCGPIIDPYTAAGAMLADRAFIIGQNEPISFSSLRTYPSRVREFYPDFSTAKMKVIINKVRGWDALKERQIQHQEDIFAAIPFTMEIVDVSEGIQTANEMQLMIFENHIAQIVERVFRGDHRELIPDQREVLPPQWNTLLQSTDRLEQAPHIRRLGLLRLLLPIGLLPLVLGAVLLYAATTERHRMERDTQAKALVQLLERTIVDTQATDPARAEKLHQALSLAQNVNPDVQQSLNTALSAAREVGVQNLPPLPQGDTSRENLGIGILLGGVAIAAVGSASSRSRKNYLSAIQGLRKGGAQWLVAEMKSKRSARRTLDQLVRMAQ